MRSSLALLGFSGLASSLLFGIVTARNGDIENFAGLNTTVSQDDFKCGLCQSVVIGVETGAQDFGCGWVVETLGKYLCKKGDTACVTELQGYCNQIADLINDGRLEPRYICQQIKPPLCPPQISSFYGGNIAGDALESPATCDSCITNVNTKMANAMKTDCNTAEPAFIEICNLVMKIMPMLDARGMCTVTLQCP